MADFNAKDPNAWRDRRAQGDAAVQSINNMPFVFNRYTNGGDGSSGAQTPASLMSILFPGSQPSAGSAPSITQALLGLLGAGGGGGGGGSQFSWAPGRPVDANTAALLAAQPPEFWNGVVAPNQLGLGRINFPNGGGNSFGL